MIDFVIAWSLTHRRLVVALALILLGVGLEQALRMPVDVFPDLTAPTVTIIAEAHGMAPEEVETLVTIPLETAVNGSPGVRRIRSSISIGIGVVWVEFEWGTDVRLARQIVAEKVQLAAGSLPPDLAPPILAPVSSIMGEVMFLALSSDRHTPMELKTVADWTIRRQLIAEPGVSQVTPIGGETRQLHVVARPDRLAAHGVTLDELAKALAEGNANASAGFLVEGGQEYLIHVRGRARDADDLARTVVAYREGRPVQVGDLAAVRVGAAPKRGDGSYNARPAVILGVQKQPGANTLELTRRLETVLDRIQRGLPEGMRIHSHVFRQADFIQRAIENLLVVLRDGALLVVLVVGIFLLDLKATLITVLAIPLSLAVTVLVLHALGAGINTMTLGGMAIAVGDLVDDAVVDVENVVRRLKLEAERAPGARRPPLEVVLAASREIRGSIVFATLIIVLVFCPLFFLDGVEGRLLAPLGLAFVVSLAASLAVALTVTPALAAMLLSDRGEDPDHGDRGLVRLLKSLYAPVLDFALGHWFLVAGSAGLALAGALAAFSGMGRAFLPDFNEGALTIGVVTVPGTSLEESNRLGDMVERILLEHPEVSATARRTGRAELDEHAQGVNASELDIGIRPAGRSREEFLAALRASLSLVPGATIAIGQPISHRIDHMLSGTRASIAVKIFGPDLAELRRLAREAEAAMAAVPGVVDLAADEQSEIPILDIKLRRDELARVGLTVHAVNEVLEAAFQGIVVSRVLEGQRPVELFLRFPDESRQDLDAIRATLLATPGGGRVPLHAVAEIRRSRGPNMISRENVERKIVVMCNVAGRDLGGVVRDVETSLRAKLRFPDGYRFVLSGQFESAEEASRRLLVLGILVVLGTFMLLYSALGAAGDALLVMVNLPLALIGGVGGVYLAGGTLSVASIIGFITLFGIATRNGLMMVTHIQHLVDEEGVTELREAVRRGAMERLSPILMTALAAGLALIPLAMAGGQPGSEIQTPMAIVILCGLTTSTVLNMVVVPALYMRFGTLARR